MRFYNRNLFRTSYALKRNEFQKILTTYLNLTSADANKFLDMNSYDTFNLPRYRIIKNCLICQKYNVNVDSLEKFHYCLRLYDYTLEHRINILKDIGVPVINTSLVNKLISHMRTKVPKFKETVNIPAKQNIATNIFNGKFPKDISELELSDEMTVQQYYQACLLYCKTRIFNLSYLDDKILLHSYLKIKSISMIAETLKVLRIDLHYDDKMIKKNPSVIIASADNIRSLLNSFTDILGIPIVTLLRKYPQILFQDVDNIKRLLMLFEQYKIPDKYVKNCMKIFLISNETFLERIEMIKHHPDLNIWYKHPKILHLIYHFKKAKQRMEYIDIMKSSLKGTNPTTLLSPVTELDRFIQTDTVSSKHNLKYILIGELGVDKSDLLMRHQHWKTVACVDIVKMLRYLKKHFTINEICSNIHIVLYEQSRVKKVLADLKQQYSQSTEYSFTNSQYLALCLYMLEKDNHFTGDGIWNNENTKQQSFEEQSIERFDDNIVENNDLSLSKEDDDSENIEYRK